MKTSTKALILLTIAITLFLASCGKEKLPLDAPAPDGGVGRKEVLVSWTDEDGVQYFTHEGYKASRSASAEVAVKDDERREYTPLFKEKEEDDYGIWYAEVEAPDGGEPLVMWRVDGPGMEYPVTDTPTLAQMQEAMWEPEPEFEPEPTTATSPAPVYLNEEELYWMYQIVEAEVRDQPVEDKMIITEIILNRVDSPLYPDNVIDVIFQYDNGWQFSPVLDGSIYSVVPPQETKDAVNRVLAGERVLWDPYIVGFCTWDASTSWFWNHCEYVEGYEYLAHMMWRMSW